MKKLYALFLLSFIIMPISVMATVTKTECNSYSADACKKAGGCFFEDFTGCDICKQNEYGSAGRCYACSELKDADGKSYWENAAEGSAQSECYADCDEIAKNMTKPEHGTWELTLAEDGETPLTEKAYYKNKCDISLVCDGQNTTNVCNSYYKSSDTTCAPNWTELTRAANPSEFNHTECAYATNCLKTRRLDENGKEFMEWHATECMDGYKLAPYEHDYNHWGELKFDRTCTYADGTTQKLYQECSLASVKCTTDNVGKCADQGYVSGDAYLIDGTASYDFSTCKCTVPETLTGGIGVIIRAYVHDTKSQEYGGQWRRDADADSVLQCGAGYYENNKTCIPVGAGYYSVNGNKGRYPCPPGKTTPGTTTAASEAACKYVAGPSGTRFCDNLGCFTIPAGATIVEK